MAADVTGIITASLIAVLGFFVIPASRRKAKRDLHDRLAELRTNLVDTLSREFAKELDRSMERIEEAIAPYSRFVRAETAQTEAILSTLQAKQMEIADLRTEIESW
jgi:hypothetical protein